MVNILISGAGGDICNGLIKSFKQYKNKDKIYVIGSRKFNLQKSSEYLKYYLCPKISPKISW